MKPREMASALEQQQQQQDMPTPRTSSRGDDLDRSSHGAARGAASNMRHCQLANNEHSPTSLSSNAYLEVITCLFFLN